MSVSKETEAVRQLQDSLGQQDLALNSAQSIRVAFDKCDLTALQQHVDIFRQCINARNYTTSFSDKDKENFEKCGRIHSLNHTNTCFLFLVLSVRVLAFPNGSVFT